MHPIKREILHNLILSSRLRFAELKPEGIENNHFIYYLKQLVDEGLIEKDAQEYCLSFKGKRYAERISLEDLNVRLQPKTVSAVVCSRGDEVLLYEWMREPGYGMISLVNGKLHFGETVHEAANRELKEKTGLEAELEHIGNAYIREFDNGQCYKHQLAHVFVGRNVDGEMRQTKVGKPIWVKRNQLAEMDLLPGTTEILEAIEYKQPVWFEEFSF